MLKVSRTYRVDLAIEYRRDVVCRLLYSSALFFLGAAPTPYVEAAPVPSLTRSTTVLLDTNSTCKFLELGIQIKDRNPTSKFFGFKVGHSICALLVQTTHSYM